MCSGVPIEVFGIRKVNLVFFYVGNPLGFVPFVFFFH